MKTRNLQNAALLFALLSSSITAQAVVFTNDSIIGFQDQTYDNTDVIVSNCTLTVDGSHIFASVRVATNGVLTHTFASNGWVQASLDVNDEPLVLNGLNAVTLSNAHVDLGWLELRDASTNFYTIVTDYVVSSVAGGLTAIERSTNSTIPDGATVFAIYRTYGIPSGLSLSVSNDVEVESGGAINVNSRGYAGGYGSGAGRYAGYPICGGGGAYGGNGGMGTNPPGSSSITNRAAGGDSYGFFTTPNDKGSGGGRGLAGLGGTGGGLIRLNIGGTFRMDGTVTANGQDATNSRSGGGAGGGIWITAQTITGSGALSADGGRGEPVYGGGGAGGRIAVFCQTNTLSGTVSAMGGRGAQQGGAGTLYAEIRTMSGTAQTQRLVIENNGIAGAITPLPNSANYPKMHLTVRGAAQLGVSSSLNMGSLYVASNSWISSVLTSLPKAAIALTISSNAVIEAGAGIVADGCGYPARQGNGAGGSLTYYVSAESKTYYLGGGAGFGGLGAASMYGAAGGASYGSASFTSTSVGSGGGGTATQGSTSLVGGAGGGAIQMSVTGDLVLDGTLAVNGENAPGLNAGGGSGGSIGISARRISGGGIITACGGAGNALGGGGGGGRIAITCKTNSFAGDYLVHGGTGQNTGGAGTVFVRETSSSTSSVLMVDNNNLNGTNTPVYFYDVSGGNVIVRGGARVRMSSSSAVNCLNLVVGSNSCLQTYPGGNSISMNIISNLVIDPGGVISADGAGNGANMGSGMGRWLLVSSNVNLSSGGGGGKCGFGAASSRGAAGGNAWDISAGSTAGSGGGAPSGSPTGDGVYRGGAGGGGINLTVGRTCLIDGILSANGNMGVTNGGGGSGGGIQISSTLLTGSGIISACGGDGHALGGGGGGGCIRILCRTNLFSGILRASGGGGARVGGAGLIVQSLRIIADNGGRAGTNTIFSLASRADSVVIRGGAVLQPTQSESIYLSDLFIASNSFLQMLPVTYGVSINVTSNLVIEPGAGIRADGMGYGAGSGPGAGQWLNGVTPATGGGGGNAGFGAASALGALGGNAGPFVNAPGSGGGSYTLAAGSREGAGGGSLNITVGKTFVVDGFVSANGNRGSTNGGGGSGGTIRVGAATLSGSGLFSVCGGEGNSLGGGGGGGYLNISCKSNAFSGWMRAWGGGGINTGGAGLITVSGGTQTGQIIMDNGGLSGTNTPLPSNVNMPVFIRGGAVVQTPSGTMSFSFPSLTIESNGWLQLSPNTSFVQINSANVVIEAGGGILGDGMGYAVGQGPHSGRWLTPRTPVSGGGGGNGGCGAPSSGGAPGGLSGNSIIEVPQAGSGGGGIPIQNQRWSAGGAALQLTAPSSLVLNGLISANGNPGYLTNGGTGGGAGGSILIFCGSITGDGLVSVCGGAGQGQGGGGGGGRVRILSNTNDFLGTIRAYGGGGTNIGGAGTICLQTARTSEVIVDNGGRNGSETLLTSSGLSYGLIITNGASVIPDRLSVDSLRVCSNSWIKQQSNSNGQMTIQSYTVTVQGDAMIEAGGGWLADGRGFASGSGTGRGYYFGDGAGYGGCGGINMSSRTSTLSTGAAYGSPWNPVSLGSGGGVSYASPKEAVGGSGGGLARLIVNGHLTLDGSVSANGTPGTSGAGGGSGGSIWITAGTLSGAGRITADGGGGLSTTGGGGGGRIAIEFRTNRFSGPVTAFGGIGQFPGGAGTLYLRNMTNILASLLLDNGGISGAVTPVYQSTNPYDLFISSGAAGCMGSQERWIKLNNLFLEDGGAFSCLPLLSNLDLVVMSNVVISSDSSVVVDGHGYSKGMGPGAGRAAFGMGSGGGYGGVGGSVAGAAGGGAYGSSLMPADSGSGGGVSTAYINDGCQGGGVIRFNIGGTLELDGRISADGNPGLNDNSGGGAGGSVWITAGALSGSGRISASGGMGEPYGGAGGGGGRIAMYARKASAFSGSLHAWGAEGSAWGDDGTVFFSGFPGLNVITQWPSGAVSQSVGTIDLTFNAAFDTASFSNLMVTLATPAGDVPGFNIYQTAATMLRISFATQSNGGLYTLSISGLRDLTGRPMSAHTGTFVITLPVINGVVSDSGGHPVTQATLQAVCNGSAVASALTDADGRYSITIPLGSSPVIVPQKDGWQFDPPSISYPGLAQACFDQNYTGAVTLTPASGSGSGPISELSWQGISGVQYQLMTSSNLVDWIPYGPPVTGTNGPITIPNPPNAAPSRFYRVHVVE